MKNLGKWINITYPIIVGLTTLLIFNFFEINYKLKGYDSVLNSIITFSSIIIGFYTAMYGVLLTLNNSDIFKKFREVEIENLLKKQLYESLITSFVILILSIALQILINYDFLITIIFFNIWSFFLGYFLSTSFRSISLLLKIMFKNTEKIKDSTVDDISKEERDEMIKKLKKEKKDDI